MFYLPNEMFSTNTFEPLTLSPYGPNYLIDIFAHTTGNKHINVDAGANIAYLVLIYGNTNVTIDITTQGPDTSSQIEILCLGQTDHTTSCTVTSHLCHDTSSSTVHMVTFLPTGTSCSVQGNITIAPKTKKVSGHLLEENIILGDNVTIQTLPMLDVHANDVRASHGARIERIDAKKLFYAQSRGLRADQATGLIIGGYFDLLFGSITSRITDMAEKAHVEAIKHNYQRILLGEI